MLRFQQLLRIGLFSLPALLAGLVFSCGSSDSDRLATKPLEAILTGPIQLINLTSDSATVRVETKIDVVCSVVFGLDNRYGYQSSDPDMGGRAHREHAAPLRGLKPDTVYHYRLQGTGPDGTMYVSDSLTFRTPPGDQSEPKRGVNLASSSTGAKVVDWSSQFGGVAWRPENAIDGDPSTEWSTAGDGDKAFISVQLAQSSELTAVGLWTRTMGSSGQIMSFRVITEDGTNLGPFNVPDSSKMYVFPVSVTAQRLRFEVVKSSGGNTGVVELAAYGK